MTTGLRLGGAERQVADLAAEFAGLGHAVAVMSLTGPQEMALPPGITVFSLGMSKSPPSMLSALRTARRLVRAWNPDIVHSHMVHANLFARVLRPRRGDRTHVPVVCTAHSLREGGALRMLAYRLTDRWCRLTTHVSEEGRERMIGVGAARPERIVVMPNGIDTHRFRPDPEARARTRAALGIPADGKLILNVGRLVPEKGQAALIEAFRRLHQTNAAATLLIAGDGPLRDTLSQQIHALGLVSCARLLGPRSDVPDLLNAADLFVLSSELEGLPLVVAEALACETPVVATDVSGVRALLSASGHVIPVADTPALAGAMRDALANPLNTGAGRAHVLANFSLPGVAAQWVDLYQRLLADPTGRRAAADFAGSRHA